MSGFTVVDAAPSIIEFLGVSAVLNPTFPTSGYGSPLILTVPGSVHLEAGDFIVAHFHASFAEFGQSAIITEDGWYPLTNKIGKEEGGSTTAMQLIFYKIATASEPSSYSFTPSTDNWMDDVSSGRLSFWRGVDPVSPILAFYAASSGLSSAFPFPQISVDTPALTLPIANSRALLFGSTKAELISFDPGEIGTGQVNSPSGSIIRYSTMAETINGANPPLTNHYVSFSLECADIDVSGGATDPYVWTADHASNTLSPNGVTLYVYGTVVVLRAVVDADPITWTVQGNPHMPGAAVNQYNMRQEGILISPNNSDNLYTIYGADFISKRMTIARYSRSLGTVQATAELVGAYNVTTNANNIPFEVSNDDSGLFWCSEFEDASPDQNSGRVYRYNTTTLVQETTSDWLPDDDTIIAQRCGTVGKWSENLLFAASSFFGNVGHGVYIFDPVTLALIIEIPYSVFFTVGSNGFFNDLTVDCDGNAWVSGQDNARAHVLFRIAEGYVVTAFNLSAIFPNMNGILGLHPRLDALLIGNGSNTGIRMWDIATQAPLAASYDIPAYATTGGLLQVKSSFMSQSVGVTGAGLWVSFLVKDRVTSFTGDLFYRTPYCYIQKLNGDTLAVEATYVTPLGKGIVESNALSLDTGVTPYRLWSWGRYPYPQFGPVYGLAFPSWFTTPQVPANEWGPGNSPTNTQLIQGRGFNYRMLVRADVPTVAGIGSRTCASIPVVVPTITCYDLNNAGNQILVVLHGTNFLLASKVIVSPYDNPFDGNAYVAPILQITDDTELVVSVPNRGIGQGFWFVFLANGQMSAGSNKPCLPFSTSIWKTRKVWFESLEP